MYKCNACGKIIEEISIGTDWVPAPFGNGKVPMESTDYDCSCGGEFEEVFECDICSDYFLEEDMHSNLCNKCYKNEYPTLIERFKKIIQVVE